MARELLFVGVWKETWKELVDFLEVKEYQDEAMIKHLKELLEEKK